MGTDFVVVLDPSVGPERFGRPERGIRRTSPVSSSTCRYSLDVSLCLCLSLSACRPSVEIGAIHFFEMGSKRVRGMPPINLNNPTNAKEVMPPTHMMNCAQFLKSFPLPHGWCNLEPLQRQQTAVPPIRCNKNGIVSAQLCKHYASNQLQVFLGQEAEAKLDISRKANEISPAYLSAAQSMARSRSATKCAPWCNRTLKSQPSLPFLIRFEPSTII